MTRSTRKGVLAVLALICGLGTLVLAPPASAVNSAAPAGVGVQDWHIFNCDAHNSPDGKTIHARCFDQGTPGWQFRVVVTTCGVSSCQRRTGPWWNQDGQYHSWTPGGFIAGFDGIDAQ